MFPGMNPKKMQAMMKQLGIKQEDIPAKRVIIEGEDKNIVIEEPNVAKVEMQGQETWQITGIVKEEEKGLSGEDIKTVMEKTGKSEEEARQALEKAKGDLAEAILGLS